MKSVYFIGLTSLFLMFTGCQLNQGSNVPDKFDKSVKDDVLEKTDKWYEIDSSRDNFRTFQFKADKMKIDSYASKNFRDLIDTKSYNLYYTSDTTFNFTKDGENYSCEVTTCNNDEFILIGCKPQTSGLNDILYCGWNSQEKADANME